ncbi:MAG: class I SAM-dependent methyltransferase [Gemmatimonadales bacterium]
MRFYRELAHWWPLFSPPVHYEEEAADLLRRVPPRPTDRPATLLELGAGGGSLASHLAAHYRLTLTDVSPGMLAVNRQVNPAAEFAEGDMRTLRLGRRFDLVLIHDAIMYLTTEVDLRAALVTAAEHCRPDGAVVVLPDYVRETFQPGEDCGGEDGPDGRGFRYLEWRYDPDPADDTYLVDYAFLLREPDGSVAVEHDRHVEGLFERARWLAAFTAAGMTATSSLDPWGRDVFLARPS